ncbi:hypothetical protein ICL16_24750 [Iningainema sp. BLCCT55]|uniref:Uncharacterized protein n=1 Tax=Iningainema tapete BLCC-T55 TaxID=2748662 RepID=A0A8J6XLC8_9CYAN|nr:hypothetical protein [Iningainema tapete]MBD2775182.1 hypothetical protein [Iningainema tapete BLCC-T55]
MIPAPSHAALCLVGHPNKPGQAPMTLQRVPSWKQPKTEYTSIAIALLASRTQPNQGGHSM